MSLVAFRGFEVDGQSVINYNGQTRYVAYRLAKRSHERDWRFHPEKWEF